MIFQDLVKKSFQMELEGVIIGRALYDKKFTFSDALYKIKEVNT